MVIYAILIALALLMPGCFVLGFFCAMKAVQMGLKWKMQAENGVVPTTKAEDKTPAGAQSVLSPDLVNQWLTGIEPKDDDK